MGNNRLIGRSALAAKGTRPVVGRLLAPGVLLVAAHTLAHGVVAAGQFSTAPAPTAVVVERMPPAASEPLRVVVQKTPADDAHERDREAKSDAHEAADLVAQQDAARAASRQVYLSIATLAVSAIGALFLFLAWRDAQRTVKAAETSAEIARASLAASHRPWLHVSFNVSGLRVERTQVVVAGNTKIENVGNMPALNAHAVTMIRLLTGGEDSRAVALQAIDEAIRADDAASVQFGGTTLFPNASAAGTLNEFPVRSTFDGDPDADRRACTLLVIVGVRYRSPTDVRPRHTFFSGRLSAWNAESRLLNVAVEGPYASAELSYDTKSYPTYAD